MKRNQKKERKVRKRLYLKYGHLIGCKTKDIPEKHHAPNGGLRCFKRIKPRDEHGNKIRDARSRRCKNVCAKGSLYCKKHGGANSKALTKGKRTSLDVYRGAYNTNLANVLQIYINDPDIMDHRRELATLRLVLTEYVDRYSRNKPLKNRKKLLRLISQALEADHLNDHEKFMVIKDIVDNETTLTDGQVLDRISRLTENIGKAIERIDRVERKSDFFLTPEGLKIFIRTVIELITENVEDPATQKQISQGLMNASTKVGSGFKPTDTIDVKAE